MGFEWDVKKNKENYEKHGLCFEDAKIVFSGEVVTFNDDRKNYGEKRYISLGELLDRVIIIVHTLRGDNIRIISMRKANEREQKIYYQRLEESGQTKRRRH